MSETTIARAEQTSGTLHQVAAALIASREYQQLLLVLGDSTTIDAQAAGRLVDGSASRGALFVEDRQKLAVASGTLTTSSHAYLAGEGIGGITTVSGAARASGGAIEVDTLVVVDNENLATPPALNVYLLNATETVTNAAAWNPTDANALAKIRDRLVVASADFQKLGSNAVAVLRPSERPRLVLAASDLFLAFVATAGFTYTGTTSMAWALTYRQL